MTKQKAKQKARQKAYRKGSVIRLPISKHIDVNFREYALYVLNNRGIPSFYDGLTNVQKYILQNAPQQYNKTVSLVGKCIAEGYAHGDGSLVGAINKLARPFGCANQLLEGDGFFGTPINHDAAAARYTSVRINNEVAKIINKHSFLNTRSEDGQWDPLWLDVPIGLATSIVGIAVGYKTTVLPRSIEDMRAYLNGDIKEIHPSFIGFNGKVSRLKNMDRSWLIEGNTKVNKQKKTIKVTSLPPIMQYKNFLGKLEAVSEDFPNKISISNNSSDNIDVTITFRGRSKAEFEQVQDRIIKATKMIVTETPVFVKDGVVLVYDRVEDYLDDYKYRIAELNMYSSGYNLDVTSSELEFQKAKKEYIEFMLKKKRTDDDITKFITKYNKKVASRLDAIRLRLLSTNELKRTIDLIKELTKDVANLKKEHTKLSKIFNNMTDPTIKRGTTNKKIGSVDLFDDSDFEDFDGIEFFMGDEEEADIDE